MIGKIKNKIYSAYHETISSIAFYPALISIIFLMIAWILLSFEDNKTTHFLIDQAPYLVINNADTARSILATLIGGIISLTVFSFSMVMVLLNQASTNFSPRLLPGLISDKRNQVVLGVYLGTIIYNIMVMISILPSGDSYTLNGFCVLMGIVFGILCLGMFVFFIHSISTGIQINNILDKIFLQTKGRLNELVESDRSEHEALNTLSNGWFTLNSEKPGYFQGINMEGLLKVMDAWEINVKVIPYKGKYILPNTPLIQVDKELNEEKNTQLKSYMVFSNNHSVSENYILGIKQITEVGIKAMSPGINDPGTAIMTVDYLTELLSLRMCLPDVEVQKSDSEKHILELATINFDTLMYQVLAEYRQYCKHDFVLMEKLVLMLNHLKSQPYLKENYIEVIQNQVNILKKDIESSISNKYDLDKILALI